MFSSEGIVEHMNIAMCGADICACPDKETPGFALKELRSRQGRAVRATLQVRDIACQRCFCLMGVIIRTEQQGSEEPGMQPKSVGAAGRYPQYFASP
jgi:hypothetical protein